MSDKTKGYKYTPINQPFPFTPAESTRFDSQDTLMDQRQLSSLLAYVKEHGLLQGDKKGKRLARRLKRRRRNKRAEQKLAKLVREDVLNKALDGPFNKRSQNEGNIVIGFDPFDGTPLLAEKQFFNTHFLVVGMTASGKGTALKGIVPQLAAEPNSVRVVMFDPEKDELQHLQPRFEIQNQHLEIIDCRKLAFNPLQLPSGEDARDFIEHISVAIGTALKSTEAGIRLSREVIDDLYEDRGIFEGSQNFPTMYDYREAIDNDRTSNPKIREGLLARLDPVLRNTEIFRYPVGEPSETLLKTHSVFRGAGLSQDSIDLISGSLMTQEFRRRIAAGYGNSPAPFDLCFVIDDAQFLASDPLGFLARYAHTIRATGIGLWVNCQHSDIAHGIRANVGVRFVGICSDSDDMDRMARSTGMLTFDQSRWLANNLQPMQFLCQLPSGHRFPFLVDVAPFHHIEDPSQFVRQQYQQQQPRQEQKTFVDPSKIIRGYLK